MSVSRIDERSLAADDVVVGEVDGVAHDPAWAEPITGIPADELVRLAHNFANLKGVVDDGWYSSKNGNDIELYQLINILNAFNGNVDREGGIATFR
mgnify:CR=1 FL=1